MFWRKRRRLEAERLAEEIVDTAATQPIQPPLPLVSAIMLGPKGETRDRLATLISAWTEIRLLGTYPSFEDASAALRESAGRKGTAVLLDAGLPPPHEARSVIRLVRERFPASRIMVYGDDLDEIAIDHLYFAGADSVLLVGAKEHDVITAIREGLLGREDSGSPESQDLEVESVQGAPSPEADVATDVPPEAVKVEKFEVATDVPPEAVKVEKLEVADEGAPEVELEVTEVEPIPEMKEPPPHEESSRPPRERALVRSLRLLRPRGRRRGEGIPRRAKMDESDPRDEQSQAVARNLERLVASLQLTEPEGNPEQNGVDEHLTDTPGEN